MDAVTPRVARDLFGTLPDGTPIERIRLGGPSGVSAAIITYGAAVQALHVPDREGRPDDVVLGHDTLAGYLAHRTFLGATVGRYANRIAGAAFTLDGTRHDLARNDGSNSLHGGGTGFDRQTWTVEALGSDPEPFVTLGLTSPHGHEGYPGTLAVRATFRIVAGTGLSLSIEAWTDRATVANVTHHGFFNLRGGRDPGDVLDHVLSVEASAFLPVDAAMIPAGAPRRVDGTPFDFRRPARIGTRIREADEQLRLGRGYDHAFCLDGGRTAGLRQVARLAEPRSGRVLDILTDQPGLQVYTGNFLDGRETGKGGRPFRQSDGICLEPQLWPDGPNRPDFPASRLDPGSVYRHRSLFRFGHDRAPCGDGR